MAWTYLLIAGVFEIVWGVGLKYTENFTRLLPSALTIAAMAVSFYCLSRALASIPLGTAYAVWTGIGAVGLAMAGIIILGESRDPVRLACIGLIIIGIIGLKITSSD
ncbi:MAG: quaternary ammonium compound efflux SMR transporter SugE [Deltaproteobacteria bacterium]